MHKRHGQNPVLDAEAKEALHVNVSWPKTILDDSSSDGEPTKATVNPNTDIPSVDIKLDMFYLRVIPSDVPKVDDDSWRRLSVFNTTMIYRG